MHLLAPPAHPLLTAVSSLSIAVSFATLMLVPLDVVSVSAGFSARTLVQSMYYILFLVIILLSFVVVPFVYFFFEEGPDASTSRRVCVGLKVRAVRGCLLATHVGRGSIPSHSSWCC